MERPSILQPKERQKLIKLVSKALVDKKDRETTIKSITTNYYFKKEVIADYYDSLKGLSVMERELLLQDTQQGTIRLD